jgi:hypothetical protein
MSSTTAAKKNETVPNTYIYMAYKYSIDITEELFSLLESLFDTFC